MLNHWLKVFVVMQQPDVFDDAECRDDHINGFPIACANRRMLEHLIENFCLPRDLAVEIVNPD